MHEQTRSIVLLFAEVKDWPSVEVTKQRFMIDGRPYQLEVGQAYEINNQKTHSVMNKGDIDRINFIFDYVPPSAQRERAAAGEGRARQPRISVT